MSIKLHELGTGNWTFHCPGCGYNHSFRVNADKNRPQWTWNGDLELPTFTPSLMVYRGTDQQCHLNMTDGMIQFHGDCVHQLKGQLVECPDWE